VARQRVQTKYAANQVRLTPQASPVNTYVQPARNDQISKALDAVTGNVSRAAAKTDRAKEQSKSAEFQIQKLMAVEAAYNDGSLGDWATVSKGFSLANDPQYGPALQVAYNQKVGTEAGINVQSELFKWDSENPNLRQSDPVAYSEQLDAITKQLLTQHLGPDSIDAVGYQSAIRTQVNAAQNQLKSQQVSEYKVVQAQLPLENFFTQLGANVNVAHLGSAGLTNAERTSAIGEAVSQTLQATFGTNTIPPKALNGATTDFLITLANENKNLDLLDIAKTISTGNGGFLYGIQSEKKKLLAAQRTLASQLSSEDAVAYAQKNRKMAIAKEDYQEAAFQYYNIHGDFEDFDGPESSQGMGAYDISVIQKRIADFKESPTLTQNDYENFYNQFSSVTELTPDRAQEMLEKMTIGSMAEYRLAKAAMGDVINKRGSVFTGDSYKAASSLIDKKYGIDPQKNTSISSISMEAANEFNMSQADFKQRVTSYVVDQRTLDKALKVIGEEDLSGTSLHLLDYEVKYRLYKQAAEDAIAANATDINSKTNIPQAVTNVPQVGATVVIGGRNVTVTQTTASQ
tara:strand:- start:1151 stop:2869 length:1719 start_codon:yes stop_codon:yes gene_type:complete